MSDSVKKNLLAIVQEILPILNADNVNSISDTEQATDVAKIVQSVYFDMVVSRDFPELKEVIQLEGLSDSTRPTYLKIPANVKFVERLDYDVSETSGTTTFRTLEWVEPNEFLDRMMNKNTSDSTKQTMSSVNSSASFIISNNKMPTYFSSFDDEYLVCDSFDSTEESTLQGSKTRAYVSKIPTFTLTDTFIPDLDEPQFRAMVNEAKAVASAIENRTVNPKLEQHARKSRMNTQNDRSRIGTRRTLQGYGRS